MSSCFLVDSNTLDTIQVTFLEDKEMDLLICLSIGHKEEDLLLFRLPASSTQGSESETELTTTNCPSTSFRVIMVFLPSHSCSWINDPSSFKLTRVWKKNPNINILPMTFGGDWVFPTPYSKQKIPTPAHSTVILPLTSTKPGYYLKHFIDLLLTVARCLFTHCSDTFLHQADLWQHAQFQLTRADDVLCSSLCTWALSFCVTFIWSCNNRWIASVWLEGGRGYTESTHTKKWERHIWGLLCV